MCNFKLLLCKLPYKSNWAEFQSISTKIRNNCIGIDGFCLVLNEVSKQGLLKHFMNSAVFSYSPQKKAAGAMVIVSVRPSHIFFRSISHKWINLIREAYSVQEPLLYLQYFWSYCPLYIFFLEFLSGAYLQKYES